MVAFMAFSCLSSVVMSMSLGHAEAANNEGDEDAEWLKLLSESRFEKRKFAASDPRSLFNAVYSNYK